MPTSSLNAVWFSSSQKHYLFFYCFSPSPKARTQGHHSPGPHGRMKSASGPLSTPWQMSLSLLGPGLLCVTLQFALCTKAVSGSWNSLDSTFQVEGPGTGCSLTEVASFSNLFTWRWCLFKLLQVNCIIQLNSCSFVFPILVDSWIHGY